MDKVKKKENYLEYKIIAFNMKTQLLNKKNHLKITSLRE